MVVSYHLPNKLPRGLLSTRSDDKPESTEKAAQMQSVLFQTLIQYLSLENSFNFLGLSFLISKMKNLEKDISKAPASSKIRETPFSLAF